MLENRRFLTGSWIVAVVLHGQVCIINPTELVARHLLGTLDRIIIYEVIMVSMGTGVITTMGTGRPL